MDSPAGDNSAHQEVFYEACQTGDTSQLARLISEGQFDVNQVLASTVKKPPLIKALEAKSVSVAAFLLQHGTDLTNPPNEELLGIAIRSGEVDLIQLLLDWGLQITKLTVCDALIKVLTEPWNLKILKVLSDGAEKLVPTLFGEEAVVMKHISKYLRLVLAVRQRNNARVVQLLREGDYEYYANVLGEDKRPAFLAFYSDRCDMLYDFVRAGEDLELIFWNSVWMGYPALAKLCTLQLAFDSSPETFWNAHYHGHDFWLGTNPFITMLMQPYKEIANKVGNIVEQRVNSCEVYEILLQHGVLSEECSSHRFRNDWHHECNSYNTRKFCKAAYYIQKRSLLDPQARHIDWKISFTDRERRSCPRMRLDPQEWKVEIERMKTIGISQTTSFSSAKSLYDFLYFDINMAARYSKNEIILNLYNKHAWDFNNLFPVYGFALNYQLHRGTARQKQLDAALELLTSALGVGLPQDISELVFANFSNGALKALNLSRSNDF